MTIGLSRSARLLLAQLVDAHRRGERDGLGEDQLWFTLSARGEDTTIEFASDEPPLRTSDRNAIPVLQANGLIERFTTIERHTGSPRYLVTQAAITAIDRIAP